jgi:hypothetical protein
MPSIQPTTPTTRYPALLGQPGATGGGAPVVAAPATAPVYAANTYLPSQPAPQPVQAAGVQYNWNYANPRDHIFDFPYDGYAMNKGLMKLGGVRFWASNGFTRSIASMITKIPNERLKAYYVREKFMQLPGMKPDFARLLQVSYAQKTGGQMPTWNNAPLSWLGQYAAPGGVNDWVVRGPFLLELNMLAVNYAMQTYHHPEVPGNRELEQIAQQAAMKAPPQGYQQPGYGGYPVQPGYGGYPQPGYPGYPQPGYPGYQYGDPIQQIGNLIGQIGQIFK